MRRFVAAKLHGLTVTSKQLFYHGSVTVDNALLEKVGMEPFEMVWVVNLNNGQRWQTYLLPGNEPGFSLNGGGARLGEIGDRCVLFTEVFADEFEGAHVLEFNWNNDIVKAFKYIDREGNTETYITND